MEQRIIRTTSAELVVYQSANGKAPRLVFLHGDNGVALQWEAVMAELSEHFKAIAFDQRGHGASSPAADDDYSFAARADDLHAVVSDGGSDQVVLVAHSGAAGVALEYVKRHGAALRGLFLLDPATDPQALPEDMREGFLEALRSDDSLGVIQGYYASIAGNNLQTIARVTEDATETVAAARLGVGEALLGWNPGNAMAEIGHWAGPLMMAITKLNDNPASIRHLSASSKHIVLSDAGHWPQLDDPAGIARSVMAFVEQLD